MARERAFAGLDWSPRDRLPNIRAQFIELCAVAALLFTVVVAFQIAAGAYEAEFGDDEASHYVSGLLIHDYLVGGWRRPPLDFLKFFHSHYPLVGIGHWPPLYYGVEAAWMLVFSSSRHSMLALTAAVSAATALVCYIVVARRVGRALALFVALGLLASPVMQAGSKELMLDIPVAFLCLLAMLFYARYLDTGSARCSLGFGMLAAAALLVKGNAGCLALLPPFAVLIGRRFDLLRKISFWLPMPMVAVIVGPWYAYTYGFAEQGFRFGWGADYLWLASTANAEILYHAVGPLVLAAAAIGVVTVLSAPRKTAGGGGLVGASALLVSVCVFQSVVPAAIQDRYLAPALPPLLILAARGAALLSEWAAQSIGKMRVSLGDPRILAASAAIFLALSMVPSALVAGKKEQLGLVAATEQVWAHRVENNPSVLIVSDGRGEAATIAELAMIDPHRPSLFAVRGSRLLGAGGYNNQDYLPRFKTPAEVMAAIDDYAIPLVLLRASDDGKGWAHLRQVEDALTLYPDRWELIYRDTGKSPNVFLYRVSGNASRPADIERLVALSSPRSLTGNR